MAVSAITQTPPKHAGVDVRHRRAREITEKAGNFNSPADEIPDFSVFFVSCALFA
jgi:hypothetical protein